MKRTLLSVLLGVLFFLPLIVGAQSITPTWVDAIGGAAGDEVIQSTVVDASGNVYIGGSFEGTVNFNPNGTAFNLTSAGSYDAFFAKYTSAGILVWANKLGSTGGDEIYAVQVDASGNVYVAGYFTGTVDFDPSAAVGNLTSGGLVDIFYGKYSSSGALTWANAHGSADNDAAIAIKVDPSGNVYVTGYFFGTVDFDPNNVTVNSKVSAGGTDIFLMKLTNAGALSWIDTFGSSADDVGYSVDVDATNVYVSGYYSGTADFDPGTANSATGNLGGTDGFFAKYTIASGALVWWATVRSTGDDEATSIAVSGTNFYLGGIFSDGASFFSNSGNITQSSNGLTDAFVTKYDGTTSLPDLTWINSIGTTTDERLNLLALDASGNVYCTGNFQGTVDFDADTGTANLISAGSQDIFIASYDASAGAYLFANAIGGTSDDDGTTVAVDASNNVYLGGYFQNSASFDFSSSAQNKTSKGFWDGYVAKYAFSTLSAEPIAQPTNLVVVALNSTDFTYDITAASGVTGGYLHIYKIGSAPTFIPVDGVEYFQGDVLTDGSIVKYSDNVAAGNFYGSLTAGTTYYVKIFAYNGSGTSTNYRTTNPLSATIITTGGSLVTEPTAQPTGISFGTATNNSIPVSFTAAAPAPAGYIAIRKAGSAPTTDPVDATAYTVGTSLGDGVVVYSGAAVSFTDSGLAANTTYFYKIYSFNGASSATNYLTSVAALSGSKATTASSLATEPTTQPTALAFGTASNTTIPISFTPATSSPAGYIVVRKAGSAPTTDPVDGNDYTAGTSLGDGVVVYSGAAASFSDTGLTGATTYFYKIYSFNGSTSSTNYLTSVTPLSGSKATASSFATEPSVQPTSLVFGTATDTTIPVSYTAATGTPAGYIAIRKAGSAPTTDPADGTAYTTGGTLGDGIVAYSGSAVTFTDTGLTAGTTYFYKIYSFNGSSTTVNYLITSPLSGSKATTSSSLATEPTNQPTGLVFSSITSVSYAFAFTAAAAGTTAPDGYIGIRKTGSAPTGAPVDGVTYAYPDVIGDGTVNFVGTGTSWTQSGASPSTSYYYAIYSYKGSGTSINYKQVSPLTGSVTTLSGTDTTEPFVANNTTPTSVAKGSPITVTVQLTDLESGIASSTIYYSALEDAKSDFSNFISGTMTKTTGDTYTFQIPGTAVKEMGVEYYFYTTNGAGLDNYSSDYTVSVQLSADGLSIPFTSFGSDQSKYRIVSIPVQATVATADAIFGDDLGAYDKKTWRLFRYQGTTSELNGKTTLVIGNGYWLITNKNTKLDTGPGTTPVATVYDPVKITLPPGWNQIGNPYPYDIKWQAILDWNGNPSGITKLRTYNGNWGDGAELEKFSGGFVMNAGSSSVTLEIPTIKDPSINGRQGDSNQMNVKNPIDNMDWNITLNLEQGELTNTLGGFGMNHSAADGYDAFDDFNLPRFMNFIELNHLDKELHHFSYSRDVVPFEENHTWEFSVESNLNDPVTMKWDNSFFGNNSKQLVLWDVSLQRGFDMRNLNRYVFNRFKSGQFKVFFGDEKYIEEKTAVNEIVFHDVFPNPAKNIVKVSFSIPTEDRLTIEVIDLLGRKIATIADENFKPGYHEVMWNTLDSSGSEVTNGVYITQIKSLTRDQQKRLIINK